LIGYYQTLAEETKSQATAEELGTWSEHFTIAMVLFGGISSLKSKSEGENSLIRWRTIDLLAHIPKIETSVRYGMYHSAIQELRFLFESMIQAFYLNEGHPDASITCKLELLKEIEKQLYGIRLIDRTTLREKQHLKDLYGNLSKYVHNSYKELEPFIKAGKLERVSLFRFRKDLFDQCLNLTNRTLDAVYFIFSSGFPEIRAKIQNTPETRDQLEALHCILTLHHLGLS